VKGKVTRLEGKVQSVASHVDVTQSTMNYKAGVIYWPSWL